MITAIDAAIACTPGWRTSQTGGDSEIRTHDLLLAKQALYQLSYIPVICAWSLSWWA